MSRSRKVDRSPYFEYSKSRLHRGYERVGRFTKLETHRHERREAKKQTENLFDDLWIEGDSNY